MLAAWTMSCDRARRPSGQPRAADRPGRIDAGSDVWMQKTPAVAKVNCLPFYTEGSTHEDGLLTPHYVAVYD